MSWRTFSTGGVGSRAVRGVPHARVWVVVAVAVAAMVSWLPAVAAGDEVTRFIRGDTNLDGSVSFADVFTVLRYKNLGAQLRCHDAADVDDDGSITHTDALYLLMVIFYRQGRPPAPFSAAGDDPTPDGLGCRQGIPAGFAMGADTPDGWGTQPAQGEHLESLDCEDDGGSADLEFIHFRGAVYASPGESGIRVPVYLSSAGDVEGLTLSFYAPPELIRLDNIEFAGKVYSKHQLRPEWTCSYEAERDRGYLASSMALSMGRQASTLPPLSGEVIAYVEFTVLPAAPVGTQAAIVFRHTPANDGLPLIRNEVSRNGVVQGQYLCGLLVNIASGGDTFVRGDSNLDRAINILDVACVLRWLFTPKSALMPLRCADAADVDDNGRVELTDAISLASFLFGGGGSPSPPFPNAGKDSDLLDDLGCGGEI